MPEPDSHAYPIFKRAPTLSESLRRHAEKAALPIVDRLPDIMQAMSSAHDVILQASPGAGKTTLVPLALLDAPWLDGQRIIMLEPRRLAARAAASRMASLLDQRCGETVGYRIRQDTCVGKDTRIEVVTEGVFTRLLLEDPSLEGVGLVIFDECHERSLDFDLGLALVLQARSVFRDGERPLKLLLMSATLEAMNLTSVLDGAVVIDCPAPQFPLELSHWRTSPGPEELLTHCAAAIDDMLQRPAQHTGHVLVFLPGRGDIDRLQRGLRVPDDTVVTPLHGGLGLADQQRAIAARSDGKRKLVLSTNIAETSLTIDGVRTVIDGGYAREPVFDPGTGVSRLRTRRISRASAIQRAGRAARLGAGQCVRLWTQEQEARLEARATPEILQADLAPLALTLLAWGVHDPSDLSWLDIPPPAAWSAAVDLLERFGALCVDRKGIRLTRIGQRMATLAMHPRLARMMIAAEQRDLGALGSALAAIISDPPRSSTSDLTAAIEQVLGLSAAQPREHDWLRRVQQQARRWSDGSALPLSPPDENASAMLLAHAYPDRIARRREGRAGQFQLANGRAANLPQTDPLAHREWLVVCDTGGVAGQRDDRIYQAIALDPSCFDDALQDLVVDLEVVQWDARDDRIIAERRRQVGALVLERRALTRPDPTRRAETVHALIRERGLQIFAPDEGVRQWCARVALLRAHFADADPPWPDVSEPGLLVSLEHWLGDEAARVNRIEDLRRIPLAERLQALLAWPQPAQLDALAPTHISVPSGSRIAIDYTRSPPVLAVKLQEMFGCETTPRVVDGRVAMVVHLLSPAGRPLQVTQDLAGFWRSAYQDVRRDMRGRYPKHPWPENPLDAIPTRHTKARAGQP